MNSPTQQIERSHDEDVGDTEHNIDDSGIESVSGSSKMNFEDSTDAQYENMVDPDLPAVAFETVSGVMGLKWTYATHAPADNVLLACGIWLF